MYFLIKLFIQAKFWFWYDFIQTIALSMPVNVPKYNTGGYIGTLVFIWRGTTDRRVQEIVNEGLKTFENLKPRLLEYHTRSMKSDFYFVNTLNHTLVKHQNIFLDLHVFTKSWPMMTLLMKILQLFGRSRPVDRSTTLKYREARRYLSDFLRSPSRKGRRTVLLMKEYTILSKEHFYQWSH